jgi:hypothetical protein
VAPWISPIGVRVRIPHLNRGVHIEHVVIMAPFEQVDCTEIPGEIDQQISCTEITLENVAIVVVGDALLYVADPSFKDRADAMSIVDHVEYGHLTGRSVEMT